MTFVSNTDGLIIETHAVPVWDKAVDVLIVGAGMAGACAAIEARSAGASVLLVERSGGGTGTTAAASGHFYLGEGTSVQATLQAYNAHAANGEDPQFHKHPNWLRPLTESPHAAFDLSWGKAVYTGFTLGGLSVNVHGQVLDDVGQSVPGLYAAGAYASNIAQDSNGYASGTCLGEVSFFGRCAGRQAAKEYM